MAAVQNGKIDSKLLASIGDGRFLHIEAAQAWLRVLGEVERVYGWRPTLSTGATAYRSEAQQEAIFLQRYSTKNTGVDRRYWNGKYWWRKPGYPSAATPGKSNHGLGIAVDVSGLGGFNGTRYEQFATVATKHGFNNTEGRSINEAWHWVYSASNDKHKGEVITVPSPGEIAAAVWGQLYGRTTTSMHTIVGQIHSNTFGRLTVQRGSKAVPALQELADTKTLSIDIQGRIIALQASLNAQAEVTRNMSVALSNVAGGEAFDEEKLLTSIDRIRQQVDASVSRAFAEGAKFNVAVSITPATAESDLTSADNMSDES